jgi:class 3 adenylate cyclase
MAGTVVVVFTDIVGSTELSARLGDDVFATGDGVLAAFSGASDAVSAAVAVQRGVERAARAARSR